VVYNEGIRNWERKENIMEVEDGILKIAGICKEIGWNFAMPRLKEDREEDLDQPANDIPGMVVGTQEYIDSVVPETEEPKELKEDDQIPK